ncbi:MAG TPA: transposase [Opitutaceae bacterium]|nr:transposase [Opitutaceae bacterium]
MARKLRLEYAGAIYHVISRGNYRAAVFAAAKTRAAFLKCLDEACVKAGWVVHAWCVMSNHYHLCVETPAPNLVEGMRWLQGTFALRFNRYHREHGHVFQGRYKALLVDPDAVGAVCHYIHLNPVRAGVVPPADLGRWPWTSLGTMANRAHRPRWYSPAAALNHAGGLADSPQGIRRYLEYLSWLQDDEAGKRRLEFARLSKDWALGTKAFKRDLLKEHGEWAATRRRGDAGPRELARELWEERLAACLAAVRKTPEEARAEAKGATWKVAVAAALKSMTTASNPWLAQQLHMGSPYRLSRLVSACRRNPTAYQPFVKRIAKGKV